MVRQGSDRGRQLAVVAAGSAVLVVYVMFYVQALVRPDGTLGHDYAYALPRFLGGGYWLVQNGTGSLPWFSPAFCGGVPFFAHPHNGYLSGAQLLSLLLEPGLAMQLVMAGYLCVGFVGMFLLARVAFSLGHWHSLAAATVFAWNGYFAHRLLEGHLPHRGVMLVPLVALFLCRPRTGWRPLLLDGVLAGTGLALFVYIGSFHALIPALLALAVMCAIAPGPASCFARMAVAAVVSVGLSASKLVAATALMAALPRDGYPLPGADGLRASLQLVAQGLFWRHGTAAGEALYTNGQFALGPHEVAFSLGPVAGLWLVAGAFVLWRRRREASMWWLVVPLLVGVPWAVNLYTPGWTQLLERLPIIGNSSRTTNWFGAWMPVLSLGVGLSMAALVRRHAAWWALATVVGTVGFHLTEDLSHYRAPGYDIATISRGFEALRTTGQVPPIREVGALVDDLGRIQTGVAGVDDLVVAGVSQVYCYEPLFGYRHEWLPEVGLDFGPVAAKSGGFYNLRNPACLLYPDENDCAESGRIRADRTEDLEAFVSYRPIEVRWPARQVWANRVSVVSACLAFGVLLYLAWRLRQDRVA